MGSEMCIRDSMKSLPAEEAADPYADIPVFQTPTSDVLAKQEI